MSPEFFLIGGVVLLSLVGFPFLFSGGSDSFLGLLDTPVSYSGQAGKSVVVNLDENGLVFSDVNGGSAFGDTNQVKVSGNDSTPDYLEGKISAGSNINLVVLNEGGDESLQINATGPPNQDKNVVGVSNDDANPGFLEQKISAGSNITLTVLNDGANEQLEISSTATGGSCDRNNSCVITGTIDTNFSADFNNTVMITKDGGSTPALQINTRTGSPIGLFVWGIDNNYFEVSNDFVNLTTQYYQFDDDHEVFRIDNTVGNKVLTVDSIDKELFFYGTVSATDFNYSLNDANDSQSCPAGEALQSVGNSTSCVSVGNGDVNAAGDTGFVQFNDSNNFSGDGNLFWNNTTKRLGIGTTSPNRSLRVQGGGDTRISVGAGGNTNFTAFELTDENNNFRGAFALTNSDRETVQLWHNTNIFIDANSSQTRHLQNSIFEGNVSGPSGGDLFIKPNPEGTAGNIAIDGPQIVFGQSTLVGIPGGEFGESYSVGPHNISGSTALLINSGAWPFKVSGLGDTGVQFNGTDFSIDFSLLGADYFKVYMFGAGQSAFSIDPRPTDPNPATAFKGSSFYSRTYSDVNQLLFFSQQMNRWLPVGGYSSSEAPDYNLFNVKIRNDQNIGRNLRVDENIILDTTNGNNTQIYERDQNFIVDSNGITGFRLSGTGNPFFPSRRVVSAGIIQAGWTTDRELIQASSSSRYKTQIEDLNGVINPSLLYRVQAKTWLDKNTRARGFGVIAEDLDKIYPEFVLKDAKGNIEAVDYQGLWVTALFELHRKDEQIRDLNAELMSVKSELCKVNGTYGFCSRPQ